MEERCLWVDIVEGEDKGEEEEDEDKGEEEEEENENEHPPASDYDSQTTVDMVYATTGMNSYTVEAGHDSIQYSESADGKVLLFLKDLLQFSGKSWRLFQTIESTIGTILKLLEWEYS